MSSRERVSMEEGMCGTEGGHHYLQDRNVMTSPRRKSPLAPDFKQVGVSLWENECVCVCVYGHLCACVPVCSCIFIHVVAMLLYNSLMLYSTFHSQCRANVHKNKQSNNRI